MSTKKFLAFGKILALLMLISYSVVAKSVSSTNELQDPRPLSLNKPADSFHKNMLQPQVVHVSMMMEHSIKLVNPTVGILFIGCDTDLLSMPTAQTHVILQDVNRCKSVSPLLFPYHFFW
ncbi:hypothetical protein [Flavobacterium sp.]|uniref:hypothetical protein n=1 Tax=Flavobacterium sp. TaxID=239 RepID=UPI00248A8A48|nr:hypothetical protein [Flavobacterium sp.]MDI1318413.1 hypothetical protein [Flavobacterium sp.]